MKTIKTLSMLLFLVSMMVTAQQKDVSKEVKDAFAKKFPTAKSVTWGKESATEWEAEFKMNGSEYSANFKTDGNWVETEHKIKLSNVPEKVKSALNSAYPKSDIEEIEISETASGTVYEFEIENGETNTEVIINTSGKIIEQKAIHESDNDSGDNEDDKD